MILLLQGCCRLNVFRLLYNPASSAACTSAILPVSHVQPYLWIVFLNCPMQSVNEVGCCHYIKDTIIRIRTLNRDVELDTQMNNAAFC